MDVENFLEPEIAVAAAVVATVTSPQVRGFLRKGAVLGLAGVIAAGDAVTTFGKGVTRGVQQAANGATAKRVPVESDAATNGHPRRKRDTAESAAAGEATGKE